MDTVPVEHALDPPRSLSSAELHLARSPALRPLSELFHTPPGKYQSICHLPGSNFLLPDVERVAGPEAVLEMATRLLSPPGPQRLCRILPDPNISSPDPHQRGKGVSNNEK